MVWPVVALTFGIGVWGAYTSNLMRHGTPVYFYWMAGISSMLSWSWLVKVSPWPMLQTSMAWDIAYNVAFLLTIAFVAGDPVNWRQWLGLACFVAGLALVNT